jgi:hypothetical protein
MKVKKKEIILRKNILIIKRFLGDDVADLVASELGLQNKRKVIIYSITFFFLNNYFFIF